MVWPFNVRSSEPIGFFGEWAVFITNQDNKLLCYMVSIPNSSKTNRDNRGEPFVTIIKERNREVPEINVSVGYLINDNIGSIELEVKNDKYPLINFQDKAWAYDTEDDKHIIEKLLTSATFIIHSKDNRERYSVDAYSLNGFTEAYKSIMLLCKN